MNRHCGSPLLAARASGGATRAIAAAIVGVVVASLDVAAAAAPVVPVAPTIESVSRDTLQDALAPALAARGATAAITLAPTDAHRALAPCNQLAGFVPPGARLVGKTVVGVRCLDGTGGAGGGASWQTFVTADIRVNAPVWQATRPLRVGDPLASGDVVLATAAMTTADIEVAMGAAGHVSPARGLAAIDGRMPAPYGRTVQRPVGVGRALATADLREDGRVNAGETVRVVYVGDGFSVSSEGRTVGAADPGSNVQIRLASGTIVNGTLRGDHHVELTH